MRINELTEDELNKKTKDLVNNLVRGMRVKDISIMEMSDISKWLSRRYKGSTKFDSIFAEIEIKIFRNYRRYLPFCYASITTAINDIERDK